jgi:hypothetical protein
MLRKRRLPRARLRVAQIRRTTSRSAEQSQEQETDEP